MSSNQRAKRKVVITIALKDRLDALERELAELREAAEAEEAQEPEAVDVGSNPEVVAAAQKLAEAVARAQGIDLPLQAAEGASLPVIPLPPGLDKVSEFGGVGVAIMVAPPTEKARGW